MTSEPTVDPGSGPESVPAADAAPLAAPVPAPDAAPLAGPVQAPVAAPATPPIPAPTALRHPQPTTVERLRDWHPTDRLVAWLVTGAITLFAFAIRLWNVGYPSNLVFDETYYAKDAWSLLASGYERDWQPDANAQVVAGNLDVMATTGAFVVHPPVGKWLIAAGEAAFGMNSFGWRVSAVVFGSLLVLVTIRLARRLARSTMVGAIAGILLTLDGLAFTMSRIALLDVFQAFFLVAAVAALVADRDWFRHRLADSLDRAGRPDLGKAFGPLVWWRPWRWTAGVLFGLAIGTKWNSVYVLAVFGVLSVLWDVGARRLAGADFRAWLALVVDGLPAFVSVVLTATATYVATWSRWLATSGGWGRGWGVEHPDDPLTKAFGEGFASLLMYHKEIYAFHTGTFINSQTHPYSAHPAGWLLMLRPIGIDAVNDIAVGTDGCVGPDKCLRVINAMGTPLLWWFAAVALVVAVVWWVAGRDWRFGVPVLGVAATWLPWFQYTSRPLFFFYAITIVPFTVIALALVLGLVLGDARAPGRRRGAIAAGLVVGLVAADFAYLHPVLTDQLLPYGQWLARMWLRSWI